MNTTPPPVASNLWLNVIGYALFGIQAIFVGVIVANYFRVARLVPGSRRLLPLHILFVAIGTLGLSGVAVARMIQFPRPIWGVATLVPILFIDASLWMVFAWQRRGRPGTTVVATRR